MSSTPSRNSVNFWRILARRQKISPESFAGRDRSARKRLLGDLLLAAVCFALVFAIFFWRPMGQPDPTRHPAVGKPGDFLHVYSLEELPKPSGIVESPVSPVIAPVTLDTLHGLVTVVVFWGPWIPTSEEAVSRLAGMLPVTTRKDFRFVAVACPPPPDRTLPEDFLVWTHTTWQGLHLPTPCYVDLERTSQYRFLLLAQPEVSEAATLPPLPIPTIVLLDRNGLIRAVWTGWLPGYDRQVSQMVDRLLGPSVSATSQSPADSGTSVPSPESR